MAIIRRIGILSVLAGLLVFAHGAPQAVTGAEWKKGVAFLKQGANERAMAYAAELRRAHPEHVFPHYINYVAAERLARQGRAELWAVSARSAKAAARLEPHRAAVHLTHALWCWWNAKDYRAIAENGPTALQPGGRNQVSVQNRSLAWYYVIGAHLKLGRKVRARASFKRAFNELNTHAQVVNLSGLLSPMNLLTDLPETAPELEGWITRLSAVAGRHGTGARTFLFAAARAAVRAGDAAYHGGDYAKALRIYSLPLRSRALLAKTDGFFHDELRIRKIAAAYRKLNPDSRGKHARYLKMLIVPRSRLMLPPRIGAKPTFVAGRELRREAVGRMQRNFRIFADSMLALTKGEIHWRWSGSVELENGTVVRSNTRYDPAYKRYIAQAHPHDIEPPLSNKNRQELMQADMVLLLWPGTTRPPGLFITNGGVTEYAFQEKGRGLRAMIISEGDRAGRNGNSVKFFHHEFFHLVEWGYYDGSFPVNHGYANRRAWPRDYEGRTEFDFYEQTYKKRAMPRDSLHRMGWREGKTHLFRRYLRAKK